MSEKIEVLELSQRSYNTLKRSGIDTVEDLQECIRKNELFNLRSMGNISAEEIMEKLAKFERENPETGRAEKSLVYLKVGEIFQHPQNPRKELGDLEELSASVKANGIMQNLTVVPGHYDQTGQMQEGGYTVVIGHRRLAAAKAAGIREVPCIIAQMDESQQVSTMLLENMQRSDLTVYEQAQGFQLMLDMGETVDTVAEKTGFSKSTVRRRTKLLELDADKFKEAAQRGATLEDYAKLDKLESVEKKNEVLETIGTKNFNNRLLDAVNEEKGQKYLDACQQALLPWAQKLSKEYFKTNSSDYKYVRNYNIYGKKEEPTVPEDTADHQYYFIRYATEIDLYVLKESQQQEAAEELERQAKEAKERSKREELQEITVRHFQLRREFVANHIPVSKQEKEAICSFTADRLLDSWRGIRIDTDQLTWLLHIPEDSGEDVVKQAMQNVSKENPERALLLAVYSSLDDEDLGYFETNWNSDLRAYTARWKQSETLTQLYDLLEKLGYEMSDEEIAMQNGSHILFF